MQIYPAIDIKDGKCVRLIQGNYNKVSIFNESIEDQVNNFKKANANFIHVVDLDGAKAGKLINIEAIKQILSSKIDVQLGGGIRDLQTIEYLLELGVKRVILGTKALEDLEFIKMVLNKYPNNIAVSIDAKAGYVATNGWLEVSKVKSFDFAKKLSEFGLKTLIYTEIEKDGMMEGINDTLYKRLKEELNIEVIASGGVSNYDDLLRLRNANVDGAIIGKALYINEIELDTAIKLVKKEENKMKKVRIIPCLDIKDGMVVKGVKFENVQPIESPVELAKYYNQQQADELVFYDISAAIEKREVFFDLLKSVKEVIDIPLCVAGNIKNVNDIKKVLDCGVDKVSINSGALSNPDVINEGSKLFGSKAIVGAMDVKKVDNKYIVFTDCGQTSTNKEAISWAQELEKRGAGELVINSIDMDGVKEGYDLDLLKAISEKTSIPIVASGGAGKKEDFKELFTQTRIEAGLAASIFHNKELSLVELRKYLDENGYN